MTDWQSPIRSLLYYFLVFLTPVPFILFFLASLTDGEGDYFSIAYIISLKIRPLFPHHPPIDLCYPFLASARQSHTSSCSAVNPVAPHPNSTY